LLQRPRDGRVTRLRPPPRSAETHGSLGSGRAMLRHSSHPSRLPSLRKQAAQRTRLAPPSTMHTLVSPPAPVTRRRQELQNEVSPARWSWIVTSFSKAHRVGDVNGGPGRGHGDVQAAPNRRERPSSGATTSRASLATPARVRTCSRDCTREGIACPATPATMRFAIRQRSATQSRGARLEDARIPSLAERPSLSVSSSPARPTLECAKNAARFG
jgi:hypothetical protein